MLENEQGIKVSSLTDLMGNPIEGISNLPDTEEFFESEQDDSGEIVVKPVTFEQARNVLFGAQGKILTIIDATFTDEKRLKYVKDLVRNAFSQQGDWLFELATGDFGQFCKNGCGDNAKCSNCPKKNPKSR